LKNKKRPSSIYERKIKKFQKIGKVKKFYVIKTPGSFLKKLKKQKEQKMSDKIIQSMLDDDSYKISMQNFALELFPDAIAKYKFINRGNHRFNIDFVRKLVKYVSEEFPKLKLTDEEANWLKNNCRYLKPWYIEWLKNYRYKPEQVIVRLTKDNNLEIEIEGLWHEAILWEVKLMAVISQQYFENIDKNWTMAGQEEQAKEKIRKLSEAQCNFIEMGTRRRRSAYTQKIIIDSFTDYKKHNANSTFLGTSNCFFALQNNLKCYGSQAHEIYQAAQVLNSYK
jgi:nicotinate phosphoribosyltransferase